MTGIYKITNLQNGKIYIGQAVDINRRWSEHKSHSFSPNHISYNFAIHRAIRKYGIKGFSFEVLEECDESQLNEREIYWIQKFDSKNCGYNMTDGGDTCANGINRRVCQYSLDGRFLASFNAIRAAARETGVDTLRQDVAAIERLAMLENSFGLMKERRQLYQKSLC